MAKRKRKSTPRKRSSAKRNSSKRRTLYGSRDFARHEDAHGRIDDFVANVHRTDFRKDVVNLIHSPYFRRLEGKTQLFPENESDLFRDRLTHSIEVAQIARDIARSLNAHNFFATSINNDGDMQIDLDVIEFAGLAHDIGHPPFGHTGEYALDEKMLEFGGFEGKNRKQE